MEKNANLQSVKDANGDTASPQLKDNIKNYLIDIDGTITEDVPNEEPQRMETCMPFPDALENMTLWSEECHILTVFTSRM